MDSNKKNIIVKFDFISEQTVGKITKIVGLTKAKYLIPIIDSLNLDANPRSSKTGSVTDSIQESIYSDPKIFPFKTKGILLASSQYERLERNRIKITPENPEIEGILDGGHNTLAIGMYILKNAIENVGEVMTKKQKSWDEFKVLWNENKDIISDYMQEIAKDSNVCDLDFYVPIELLVPYDSKDFDCVEEFKSELLEICAARNNNVQLQISAKANQNGYFDNLKELMRETNNELYNRVEWKTNEGGEVKVQDIIALSWIPLSLISQVKDSNNRIIEPISPQKIYSAKGSCMIQFEKLMGSPDVTNENESDYKRSLANTEVYSALKISAELPELYDYIYEMFPTLYNAAGGAYGRITAVSSLNKNRRIKVSPFLGRNIETLSPDGYIAPLVYGLQALMENRIVDGHNEICWKQEPMEFLKNNLAKIIKFYIGIFSMCDYDPQKIGKNPQSYNQTIQGYKMAIAGIL